MKNVRVIITLPETMKRKLDALRGQGYSVAGYIRAVLVRELSKMDAQQKER